MTAALASSIGAIAWYESAAAALAPRYDALDPAAHLRPVAQLLPAAPARIADIGAGTGRDARWLAAQGHSVTAIEPCRAFRRAAAPSDPRIRWLQDRLPDLPRLTRRAPRFDLITLSGVWHHLPPLERQRAAPVLAGLLVPGGRLLLSLRSGPLPEELPAHSADAGKTARLFAATGLEEILRIETSPLQPASRARGVRWVWLALARGKAHLS